MEIKNEKILVSAIIVILVALVAFNIEELTGYTPRMEKLTSQLSISEDGISYKTSNVIIRGRNPKIYIKLKTSKRGPTLELREADGTFVKLISIGNQHCNRISEGTNALYECMDEEGYTLPDYNMHTGEYTLQTKISDKKVGNKVYFTYIK